MSEALVAQLRQVATSCEPCGSRVTCDPPPTDTDIDYLVWTSGEANYKLVAGLLEQHGFAVDGGDYHVDENDGQFVSWKPVLRHGASDYNFIVTADAEWAMNHRRATAICKVLNLMNKDNRIAVFQKLLYNR